MPNLKTTTGLQSAHLIMKDKIKTAQKTIAQSLPDKLEPPAPAFQTPLTRDIATGSDERQHIEIDFHQQAKSGQLVSGDAFFSSRINSEDRLVAVLADGLGSGIKANVLATLTGTMALKCITHEMSAGRVAAAVAEILPVDSSRGMAYSTFTIIDIDGQRRVRLVEHENPPALLLRGNRVVPLKRESRPLPKRRRREVKSATNLLLSCEFSARPGDRLLFCSDGITQAGIGGEIPGNGWSMEAVGEYALELVGKNPDISARELSRRLVQQALRRDEGVARDDISCAVIYVRQPRRLLIATGPPMRSENDAELVELISRYPGRKVVAGGTTAAIVARERQQMIELCDEELGSDLPPSSKLPGIDMVTEGMITLTAVAEILEETTRVFWKRQSPAARMAALMLDSDIIEFVVGTRINETLVAPDVPRYLDIRRNLIERLRRLLADRHLKKTTIRYI